MHSYVYKPIFFLAIPLALNSAVFADIMESVELENSASIDVAKPVTLKDTPSPKYNNPLEQTSKDWAWVSSLSLETLLATGGKTQTFFLSPGVEKTYDHKKSSNILLATELFLGIQKSFHPKLTGQLGIAIAATNSARLQGEIWDNAESQFNNHSYQYKIRSKRIALKGKLLLNPFFSFVPWISTSLGLSYNCAYQFTNSPLISESVENSNFENQSKFSFAYTLGAGIQKALNTHWYIGLGYEFADWGKSKLGRAQGQTMNSGLALNHLYTNGFVLEFTYIK